MTKTQIISILGAVVTLGIIAGGVLVVEDRYAKCAEIKEVHVRIDLVSMRIDQKIIQDRVNSLTMEMDKIEDETGTDEPLQMPREKKQRYRKLRRERDDLEDKIKKLHKEDG
jgi:cell division protein FtsB